MDIKRGIPVAPGVVIGPALVVDTEGYRIPQKFVDRKRREAEIERLGQALKSAAREVRATQEAINAKIGEKYGAIFAAHALLIEDPELVREIEELIRGKNHAAEYAVSRVMRRHAKALEGLDSGQFSARSADLFDIEKAILRNLLGSRSEPLQHLKHPVVVLAHDLSPSETATLDPQMVHAFATEAGGRTSHTAIMAGVLEIPAVVGLGRFLTDVSGGDEVIVDGNRGVLILNPDDETREHYEKVRKRFRSFEKKLVALRDLPAETKDRVRVVLMGNIEFPQEIKHCLERGADGVGLYRTEFLYLNRTTDPTEAEHVDAYLTVLRTLGPKPVVIRTLDLGADKFASAQGAWGVADERNPFLGLRSVRLCLRNLALFKTQMRAILRASAFGDVRIMFPMVSTLLELRQCKMILAEVKEDLEDEGIPFNRKLPVGTMIEVPSAALIADQLAREVSFFSIGTNDLIQYTLAADRTNEAVSSLYSPGDPAVLRLLEMVVRAGRDHNIEVSVCGEMSGEPMYTVLLIGLGLRQLSVTPHNIPEIKKIVRSVSVTEADKVAREAMEMETGRDVNNYLREITRRILPEVVG
ncbi:MAG: phosphoenolpyruvate--protein phosphotransferase [Planctomycetes bacterium]|nr:phosphoenolpyruvate--protein phosphotransferase [Planctomycetota bacterium]